MPGLQGVFPSLYISYSLPKATLLQGGHSALLASPFPVGAVHGPIPACIPCFHTGLSISKEDFVCDLSNFSLDNSLSTVFCSFLSLPFKAFHINRLLISWISHSLTWASHLTMTRVNFSYENISLHRAQC